MELPPDPVAFDAFIRGKRWTAVVTLVLVLAFDTALMFFEYRLMIFALCALVFPLVPFLVGRRARNMVEPGGAFGLALVADGVELVTVRSGAREVEKLSFTMLRRVSVHDTALEIFLRPREGRDQHYFVAGSTRAVNAMARELAARGFEAKPAEGMGTIAAVLALAFGYVLGPTLLLLGLVLLVQAAMHPGHGAFFQAGLVLVGALVLIAVGITLVRRRRASRAALESRNGG